MASSPSPTLISPPPDRKRSKDANLQDKYALQERLDRVAEEKRLALLAAGPSWREWVYYEAIKWWLAIGLLIADSLLVVQWLVWGNYLGLGLSLAAVVYAEFLLYRYLWTRPPPPSTRRRVPFRRTWYRPVEIGRWTPEADYIRVHGRRPDSEGGPTPDEFL